MPRFAGASGIQSFIGCAVLAMSLQGCATVRGAQDSVPAMVGTNIPNRSTALQNYYAPDVGKRSGMSRRDYRDYVVSLYKGEIEKRYRSFTNQLESGNRGSGLGFDLILLGLTGATAMVSPTSVDDLTTITAITSGARSTIDKRLYYDQTLPALITAMDAERASILADIARKQQLPAEQYGLDLAIDDLNRLIDAGRISSAVKRVTRLSDTDSTAQQQRLNAITAACDTISVDAASLNTEFRTLVMTNDGKKDQNLIAAARQLKVKYAEGSTPTWSSVAEAFDVQLCDDAKKRAFIDDFRKVLEAANGG